MNEKFKDASGVSDESFFGKWNKTASLWETEPKLDYDKFEGLLKVETAVKNGDFEKAKAELLLYYKERKGINFPKKEKEKEVSDLTFWPLHDAMAFKDFYLADINITSGEFKKYEISLGNDANGGRFLLSSIEKSKDMIEITSRESDAPPLLLIKCTDGKVVELTPEKDTYIRAGAYKNESYGRDKYLYVKDDYEKVGDKYIPFSDNSRRSYIFFDNNKIPSSGIESVSLVINARLKPENGTLTDKAINLLVINPYNKSWNEYEGTSEFPIMTWANYRIAHYSWQGLPGGILWERPENVPSEFFNANTRFYQMAKIAGLALGTEDEKLKKEYIYKSMKLTLDFIRDSAGKIGTGVPDKRDIESANRCHEFGSLYKLYLNSEFMTPEANVAMLKWLCQEAEFLYKGAGILYTGTNAEVTSNNYANTNRGAWHTMGFLACVGYFPEFKETDAMESVLSERIEKIVDIIIADDGCYLEPTFGYTGAVIGFLNAMMNTWKNTGRKPNEVLSKKIKLLARYLMYTAYPNGNPPRWGEAFGSAFRDIGFITGYDEDPEVLYFVTSGKEGNKPQKAFAKFDLLKIVTDRTGWDDRDSMIFMNAKNGGNHNHKDSLSLTVYSGGREILEDTGMTSYDGKYPSFDWQRHQTKSHNTVEIDGKAQRGSNFLTDNGDSDICIYSNKHSAFIKGWTDATEGFRHKRNVLWIKGLDILIVNDAIIPSDGEIHTYRQNWHVFSGYAANPYIEKDFTGKTAYERGTDLIISQADKDDMTSGLEKGYSAISTEMTDYFSYEKAVSGVGKFTTVLVPVKEGEAAEVTSRTLTVEGNTEGRTTEIMLNKNGETYKIVTYTSYENDGAKVAVGDIKTDSDAFYAVYDKCGKIIDSHFFGGTERL